MKNQIRLVKNSSQGCVDTIVITEDIEKNMGIGLHWCKMYCENKLFVEQFPKNVNMEVAHKIFSLIFDM